MPHIDIYNKMPGVDPITAMFAAGNRNDGLFGGSGGGLLPLLIGAFLFGGGRGMWGLGGGPAAGAGAFAAESIAAQSLYTPKDTAAQLATFQSWAQTNAAALAQQCCTSSANIINAVNGVNDRMFAAFVAQAQAQTAQLNNMQATLTAQGTSESNAINAHLNTMEDNLNNDIHDAEKAINAGFAAGQLAECQTQNLVNATTADSNFKNAQQFCALAKQLAECCCENRLAIANQNSLIERNTAAIQSQAAANYAALANQLNLQTCEIKTAISADGQATRALIQANQLDALRGELADSKSAVRDAQLLAALKPHHGHHGSEGPGVVQNVNVTDIATAIARALQSGKSNGNS